MARMSVTSILRDRNLRSGLAWFIATGTFGLLPVWGLLVISYVYRNFDYSIGQAAKESSFTLFTMTVVSGIAFDSLQGDRTARGESWNLIFRFVFPSCVLAFATIMLCVGRLGDPTRVIFDRVVGVEVLVFTSGAIYATLTKWNEYTARGRS